MTNKMQQQTYATAARGRRGRPVGGGNAEEGREALVAAAVRVIGRRGVAAASTRAIAAEAGVHAAMLHYLFPDKQALLSAVLETVHAHSRQTIEQACRGAPSLSAALEGLAEAYWAHIRAEPELQRAQYELTLAALHGTTEADLARRQYEGYVAMLARALRAADEQARDEATLSTLAGMMVALMDGLILQLLATGDAEAVKARLDAGVEMLQTRCGGAVS